MSRAGRGDLVVGIDAWNLRGGGGALTHLQNLLAHLDPTRVGIDRVLVWSGRQTLQRLPDQPWLEKLNPGALDRSLPRRLIWQQLALPRVAAAAGCGVLLSPGGIVPFRSSLPQVVMVRNSLPFERKEAARYPLLSWDRLRLYLLRHVQGASIRRADGVIFLNAYARRLIERQIPTRSATTVAHGIERRFRRQPARQRSRAELSARDPFRILYVSPIRVYKHQWHVARAVATLQRGGMPVSLELVGAPAEPRAVRRLDRCLASVDSEGAFIRNTGYVPFAQLHHKYHAADAFVFASTCENLPNTLIEAMASGLPIVASTSGPMPEVGGEGMLYCDPESPAAIAAALGELATDAQLRLKLATEAYERSQSYSWSDCADATFDFLSTCAGASS